MVTVQQCIFHRNVSIDTWRARTLLAIVRILINIRVIFFLFFFETGMKNGTWRPRSLPSYFQRMIRVSNNFERYLEINIYDIWKEFFYIPIIYCKRCILNKNGKID